MSYGVCMDKKRRCSRGIALSLIASFSMCLVTGCDESPKQTTNRRIYNSPQDCRQDWGDDNNCEEQNGHYYGPHYYFYGGHGYYFPRGSDTPRPTTDSMAVSSNPS